MSTPLRNVLVPERGWTWGPNAMRMRPGAERGHAGELTDDGGARDRVLAGEDQRKGRALVLDLVEGAQAAREGLLLPAPRGLELPDLPPEHLDVALDAADARVEPGHLP